MNEVVLCGPGARQGDIDRHFPAFRYRQTSRIARGFFGISDEVAKGYRQIRVRMEVKSNADADTLKRLALCSPVYDVISRSVAIDFEVAKV